MTLYINKMLIFRSILNNEYLLLFKAAILKIAAILYFKDRPKQNLAKYTKSFKYVDFCAPSTKSTVVCAILENILERTAAILK